MENFNIVIIAVAVFTLLYSINTFNQARKLSKEMKKKEADKHIRWYGDHISLERKQYPEMELTNEYQGDIDGSDSNKTKK